VHLHGLLVASLRRIVAQKKLRALVEGTNIVRAELNGTS